MLTVGIAIMVLSVVAGVGALTFVALKSSPARAAGRRVGATLAVSSPQQQGPSYHPAQQAQANRPAQQGTPYHSGQQDPRPYAAEAEPPPLVLTLAIGSVGGLVLGLLLVMIGSML